MVDASKACCYDTLTDSIEKGIEELKGKTVKVICPSGLKDEMEKYVEEKGYEITGQTEDEQRKVYEINLVEMGETGKTESEKGENCMICGSSLDYLGEATPAECYYCGRSGRTRIICPEGHFICDECHGKGAYEAIKEIALSSDSKEPISLAEDLLSHPSIPMLGCENALVVPASLMTSLRNNGVEVEDKDLIEAMDRTREQSKPPYCALTGGCGVALGLGATISVLVGAQCPKDRSSAITMHSLARTLETMANDVGPMCCKGFVRTAIGVAHNVLKEYLEIDLPLRRDSISCTFSDRHPHGCREGKCQYYPGD